MHVPHAFFTLPSDAKAPIMLQCLFYFRSKALLGSISTQMGDCLRKTQKEI